MSESRGKGIFIALSWIAFAIVAALIFLGYYLVLPRIAQIYAGGQQILLVAIIVVVAVVGGGLSLITIATFAKLDVLYPHGGEPITMRILFPVVLTLGRFFGLGKERLMDAFVDTNNSLLIAQRKRFSPKRLLILLPHCLQSHECPWKITFDVTNCKACGKCDIGELADLSKKYGSEIRVATGGTLARKVIMDFKPTFIVAVACGRDLSSGIIDSHPLPVYGVPNIRAKGPCFDTRVEVNKIEEFLKSFFSTKKE